jgi:excisionase family DNA binding protein
MESIIAQILDEFRKIIRDEMGKTSEELLSPEELAQRLKVPVSWVYENSRLGNIPTHRVGKYLRFKLNDVLKSQRKGGP